VPVDVGGAPREFEEVVVAPPVRRGPERPPPAMRVPVATGLGCLARTMLFLVVATLLLTVVPILGLAIAGGAMREWAVDLGQRFGLVEGVPAQTQRGIEAYRAGDLVTAERELREAADSYRRSAVALIYLARMRMDAGDLERGGEYLEEAVLREPDNAVAHRELAGYHLTRASRLLADRRSEAYGRDELLRAEQHYLRALQLDPTDRRARGYYACVLTDLGRQADAERALAQAGSGAWDACARPAARPTP
jgi:tetratricopeptide (TPR) repeat protein